jgi:hypothetical protein
MIEVVYRLNSAQKENDQGHSTTSITLLIDALRLLNKRLTEHEVKTFDPLPESPLPFGALPPRLSEKETTQNHQYCVPDMHPFHHDWTPEELAQREKLLKPLTLKDLKDQVNEEYARWSAQQSVGKIELTDQLSVWTIGDFEIRRRK